MSFVRKKVFLSYILVVIISLAISGILTVGAVEKYIQKNTEEKLLSSSKVIEKIIVSNSENLQALVKSLGKDFGFRITLVNLKGDVLADSDKPYNRLENHLKRPEIQKALKGKAGKSIRYSSSIKTKMMYVAVPVKNGENINSILRLSLPLSDIKDLSQFIWGIILSSTFIGFLIAFILSSILSGRLIKPLKDMAAASQEIAQGNYDRRITTHASGEIKILADSFNNMAANLKTTIRRLVEGKQKTEAILESMTDSLIAVDRKCNLIMINSAAEHLFSINQDEAIGKHLLEVIRNHELYSSVEKALTTKDTFYKEIKILTCREQIFRVNIAPIVDKKNPGVVAVLRDITELRKLEKIRTEFVANVSHELKTPLTSIAGFVETLLDGAYKSKDYCVYFLDIIKEETDRMTRLINDLLYFSRIETSKDITQKGKVDILETVMKAIGVLQTSINEKQHKVTIDIPKDINPIISEKDSLLQILINLIGNAIKYTPTNGKIKVKAREDDKYISVTVIDNGVGISQEAQSRIFERFYRVDKARSSKVSGSGLGLAVVKHLTKRLGGQINVTSKLGKGSAFTVRIPKK